LIGRLLGRLRDWEGNRTSEDEMPWRTGTEGGLLLALIGLSAWLLADRQDSLPMALLTGVAIGCFCGSAWYAGTIGIAWASRESRWLRKERDSRALAILNLLESIHYLGKHGQSGVEIVVRDLVFVGIWLGRWLERSAPQRDRAVYRDAVNLATEVRAAFAGEASELVRRGSGHAAQCFAFCQRSCAQVLDGQWDQLVASAHSAAPPVPSAIRPVVLEILRGLSPAIVLGSLAAFGTPPTWLFEGLFVFAIVYFVITVYRVIDPNFRAKLADMRAVEEFLK
jgi:hypothetical protein